MWGYIVKTKPPDPFAIITIVPDHFSHKQRPSVYRFLEENEILTTVEKRDDEGAAEFEFRLIDMADSVRRYLCSL